MARTTPGHAAIFWIGIIGACIVLVIPPWQHRSWDSLEKKMTWLPAATEEPWQRPPDQARIDLATLTVWLSLPLLVSLAAVVSSWRFTHSNQTPPRAPS